MLQKVLKRYSNVLWNRSETQSRWRNEDRGGRGPLASLHNALRCIACQCTGWLTASSYVSGPMQKKIKKIIKERKKYIEEYKDCNCDLFLPNNLACRILRENAYLCKKCLWQNVKNQLTLFDAKEMWVVLCLQNVNY